jgi:hypothetical protein
LRAGNKALLLLGNLVSQPLFGEISHFCLVCCSEDDELQIRGMLIAEC